MEKQKAQKAAVRAFAPPQMLHILSAAFELHPDLDALQETLLNDFDVIALRRKGLTVQAWWQNHSRLKLPSGRRNLPRQGGAARGAPCAPRWRVAAGASAGGGARTAAGGCVRRSK